MSARFSLEIQAVFFFKKNNEHNSKVATYNTITSYNNDRIIAIVFWFCHLGHLTTVTACYDQEKMQCSEQHFSHRSLAD